MDVLNKIWKALKGKKTHICAVALFIISGAEGMGWLTKEQSEVLKGFFMAGGLAALRLAK